MSDNNFKSELLKVKTIHNNGTFEGINMSSFSFFHKSYKRSVFKRITIAKKYLSYCAFTSSTFRDCNLQIEQLRNDNLQNCVFHDINFKSIHKCYSSTFDNSVFENCIFENLIFTSCNFNNAKFINCTFKNVELKSSNFDNCIFYGCVFDNFVFVYMNIDYAHFHCCKIYNSLLSAFQLPYIYGFNAFLPFNDCNVLINNTRFTMCEYRENLKDFLKLFEKNGENFPIINILYALQEYEKCNEVAYKSCIGEILKSNFVQFKKLLSLCNDLCVLDYEKRVDLFTFLNNNTESAYEIKEYSECKSLLLGTSPKEEIVIETGLDYQDPCFDELIKEIDNGITQIENNSFHVIKYSHKSPALLAIALTAVDIIGVTSGVITITGAVINLVKAIFRKIREKKDNSSMPKEITITTTYNEDGTIKKKIEKYKFDD